VLLRQGWTPQQVLEVCWVAYQRELAEESVANKLEKQNKADAARRNRHR
jgi:hypothetical protein